MPRTVVRLSLAALASTLLPAVVSAQAPSAGPPARQVPNPNARRVFPAQPVPQPVQVVPPPPPAPGEVQRRTAYRPVVNVQHLPQPYGAPGYQYHPGYRSILRQAPQYAYPSDASYGVRNPGHIGRFAEYYPPGNTFQNGGRDPVTVAGFDRNLPVGSIEQQAMGQSVGIQRWSAMQNHLDNFARPMGFYGFGYGVGAPF